MRDIFKKAIITIFLANAVAILVILIFRFIAPFGAVIRYVYTLDKLSPFKPIEEAVFLVKEGEDFLQVPTFIMKHDRVFFSVKLPIKGVKQANIRMRFKNYANELKIGIRGDPEKEFTYKVIDNKILDDLTWDKIKEGNLVLWQKYKNYGTIDELINNPSADEVIAQYFYDINQEFKIIDYTKSDTYFIIDYPLRGSHTFYTYIKNEPLDFTIEKQDLNMYEGKDELEINVLRGKKKIHSLTIEDDGITDRSLNKKEPQTAHIHISDLDEGVYKIELIYRGLGADSWITKITTKQNLLVFENQVFILGDKPSVLWTNAKEISVLTWHTPQVLKINDIYDLEVIERGKPFNATMGEDLNKIYSPKNDIIITGEGFYALSPESFFNLKPYNTVDFKTNTDLEEIDYIIANYTLPRKIHSFPFADWLENEVNFDISEMEIRDNTLQFVLESPGLKAVKGEIIIDLLEITVIK